MYIVYHIHVYITQDRYIDSLTRVFCLLLLLLRKVLAVNSIPFHFHFIVQRRLASSVMIFYLIFFFFFSFLNNSMDKFISSTHGGVLFALHSGSLIEMIANTHPDVVVFIRICQDVAYRH